MNVFKKYSKARYSPMDEIAWKRVSMEKEEIDTRLFYVFPGEKSQYLLILWILLRKY